MANNTVTYPSGMWLNSDGLLVRFPPASAADAVIGVTATLDNDRVLIADVDYARLPAFTASEALGQFYGGYPNNCIPSGAQIISAVFVTDTIFTSGGATTISWGLAQYPTVAGVVTEIDNDGLIDAAAITSMDAVGETITGAGALIGAKTTADGYLWVTVQVSTFTAGHGQLRVVYRMPTDEAVSH